MILTLLLLSGCWSSHEIDKSALVHGIGLDKAEDELMISVEIIKPTGSNEQGSLGGGNVQTIVLEKKADSLISGARGLIQDAKRRLYFNHARVWLISEELAKQDFIRLLDEGRRNQMFRLNSNIFITKTNPIDILSTSTLYENLSSAEIISALEQMEYNPEFTSVKIFEFFKLLEGPVPNAYLPIIQTKEQNDKLITSIEGTAVINTNKMVGRLDTKETVGLNILLNKAKGGTTTVTWNDQDKVSIEVNKSNTEILPTLQGKHLKAKVKVDVEGNLADNMTTSNIDEEWISKVEKLFSKHIEDIVQQTLKKLQEELKTDISGVGIETYRKYPKEWKTIQAEWNEIFSTAEISVDVHTTITHKGLINKSVERDHKKPKYPFQR